MSRTNVYMYNKIDCILQMDYLNGVLAISGPEITVIHPKLEQ